MTTAIQQLLAQIERDKGIQIRYACESGSRAWVFPSQLTQNRNPLHYPSAPNIFE